MRNRKPKKIKLLITESFNDLTRRQIDDLLYYKAKKYKHRVFAVKVFRVLANVKWYQFKKKKKIKRILNECVIKDISETFSFIYGDNLRTTFGDPIVIKGEKYYPPANRLSNLSAEEFRVVFDLHNQYIKKPSVALAKHIAALLYVRGVVDNVRPPFILDALTAKADRFKVSGSTLNYIIFCLQGSLTHIAKKYKHVFPQQPQVNHSNGGGFNSVIAEMAGGLKYRSTIENINVYKFLDQMEKDLKLNKSKRNTDDQTRKPQRNKGVFSKASNRT